MDYLREIFQFLQILISKFISVHARLLDRYEYIHSVCDLAFTLRAYNVLQVKKIDSFHFFTRNLRVKLVKNTKKLNGQKFSKHSKILIGFKRTILL